ncbi:MAG TPA: hypothetical protein IGR15_04395 [Synechococcus sp. M44_DOE_062]|nr:hypothetical protein [Synechococcus sp. M44_DOE_062]
MQPYWISPEGIPDDKLPTAKATSTGTASTSKTLSRFYMSAQRVFSSPAGSLLGMSG